MSKIFWKPTTLMAPVPPTLVACGTVEKPNVLTVAWTGIVNTIPPMTYISVRPERYSYDIIKNSGEFTINLPTKNIVKTTDFCGVRSGKDVDKFKEMKLTTENGNIVSVPIIKECPINIECKVKDIIKLGSHDMFLSEIVGVNVNEDLIDSNGKLHIERANLIGFAHGEYYSLGEKLGTFGYSVRKKPKKKKSIKNKRG